MRKLFAFITAILLAVSVFAQAPEKMSYQAVIRNSGNSLITSKTVGMKISILQGSASGLAIYTETHSPTTNANGLVSIEIGGGTVVSGLFTTIDWAKGPYFIKTETDPAGGTNYTITGTSQLLSVPYALHAKTSDSAKGISGNLSINTNENWASLNVGGTTLFTPGSQSWGTQLVITGAPLEGGRYWALQTLTGSHNLKGEFIIACEDTNVLVINDQTKNIGIGTNYPASKLDVVGDINVNNNTIKNIADPVNEQDASTKAYVDKQKTKVTAGSNITITGSGTQASPYVINAIGTTSLSIGQSYQGGIIFWLDATGQHGLIAATTDQGTDIFWDETYTVTNAVRDGIGAGMYNTERIIAIQGAKNFAAQACANYQGGGYGDWYLPSKYELNLLYAQKTVVGGFASGNIYWSSTEYDNTFAWFQFFDDGKQSWNIGKNFWFEARAIRAF